MSVRREIVTSDAEDALPGNIDINHHDGYIEITRRWLSWKVAFRALVFIGAGFLLFNNFILPNQEGALTNNPVFLFFAVLMIGAIYSAVAGLLNTSSIYVSKEAIKVRHKPLPWPGNKRLQVEDIKQLYAKEKRSTDSEKNTRITYEIYVVTGNGKDIKLIAGLEKNEQAVFIEREIEKYLSIKDEDASW